MFPKNPYRVRRYNLISPTFTIENFHGKHFMLEIVLVNILDQVQLVDVKKRFVISSTTSKQLSAK